MKVVGKADETSGLSCFVVPKVLDDMFYSSASFHTLFFRPEEVEWKFIFTEGSRYSYKGSFFPLSIT